MSMLISRGGRSPLNGIDWSNPITSGLKLVLSGDVGMVNLVTGKTLDGSVVFAGNPYGRAIKGDPSRPHIDTGYACSGYIDSSVLVIGESQAVNYIGNDWLTFSGTAIGRNFDIPTTQLMAYGRGYSFDISFGTLFSTCFHLDTTAYAALHEDLLQADVSTVNGGAPNSTPVFGSVYLAPTTENINLILIWERILSTTELANLRNDYSQLFRKVSRTLSWSTTIVVGAVQLLVPTSDVATGTWAPSTGATLWGVLDETTADSADYIFTTAASDYCEVGLGAASDPAVSIGHILKYRLEPGAGSVTIALKQGATMIASWTETLTGSVQNISHTLNGTQTDSITDYTNLRVSAQT